MEIPAKSLIKRAAFALLASAPLLRGKLARMARDQRLTVLAFHRVAPADGSAYPPLDPVLFEEAVRFCRANFELLTFAELDNYRPGRRPPMIITFDDGYKDFVDYAAPILKRHGVRVNHNVIPGCIDSGLPPLNVHVQDYVGRAPAALLSKLDIPGFGRIELTADREALGRRASAYIKNKPRAEQVKLAAHLFEQFRAFHGFAPTPMMNIDDVRSIAGEHELGAHSFDHATLLVESDEFARDDARACQDWFAGKLGWTTDIYALPNGAARCSTGDILRAEGFRFILGTGEKHSAFGRDEHPRFTMDGLSKAEVRFRSTGFVRG